MLALWLYAVRVSSIRGANGGDAACRVNRVVGELPLPGFFITGPMKASSFQFLPHISRRNGIKKHLQSVVIGIGNDLAAVKFPAAKSIVTDYGQLLYSCLYAVDLLIVVRERIGGKRNLCPWLTALKALVHLLCLLCGQAFTADTGVVLAVIGIDFFHLYLKRL